MLRIADDYERLAEHARRRAGQAPRKEYRERLAKYRFPLWAFHEICNMAPGEWEEICDVLDGKTRRPKKEANDE